MTKHNFDETTSEFEWSSTGFYIGYVPLKNGSDKKEPAVPYKDKDNHIDIETARGHKGFSAVLDRDAVLIECDDKQNSDLLLKVIHGESLGCLMSDRKGGHGFHSLFLNAGNMVTATKVMLACGIFVDVKVGARNGLECLKWQGVERTVIYNQTPYQETPKYFTPLKGCNIDFASMKKGDGRNSTLFSYILTLQRNDFTVEEIRECIGIINKYILKEPVADSELEVILRDEAFKKKAFFNGKTFLHDEFAKYIRKEYHIKVINNQLHIYQAGVYVCDENAILTAMVKELPSLTDMKRHEVLKQLRLICESVPNNYANLNLIAFRNGIYDIETDTLLPFSPDIVMTNRIPWDYNSEAYSELADKTLDKIACHDPQIRTILEECVGSCFYRSNTLGGGKAFILTGEGSNGKSTFIEVIQEMLGEENYSTLDFKDLGERFSTVMMFGKLANLGDDISCEFNPNVAVFKKISRGNAVDAEHKGQPKFSFIPYCKLIFSANTIPRMKDDTGAALNRLVIIPFNAKFSKQDADFEPGIKYKLSRQESIEYFIKLGIAGLKRVLKNLSYSTSKKVDEQIEEYRTENNPVLAFIEEYGKEAIENEPKHDVYVRYQTFCAENGFKPLSTNMFPKQIHRFLNLTTGYAHDRHGKTIKIYISDDG